MREEARGREGQRDGGRGRREGVGEGGEMERWEGRGKKREGRRGGGGDRKGVWLEGRGKGGEDTERGTVGMGGERGRDR